MKIIIEIVEFNVEENLLKEEFIEIVNDLELKFYFI